MEKPYNVMQRSTLSRAHPQQPLQRQQDSIGSRNRVRFSSVTNNHVGLPSEVLDSDQRDIETDSEDEIDLQTPNLERQAARRPSQFDDVDLESGRERRAGGQQHGLLSLLLRLQDASRGDKSTLSTPALTPSTTPPSSRGISGTTTPLQGNVFSSHFTSRNASSSSLTALIRSVASAPFSHSRSASGEELLQGVNEKLRKLDVQYDLAKAPKSANKTSWNWAHKKAEKKKKVRELIAKTIDKQRYIEQLCRALIRFGAPSHRLEAYMRTVAQYLAMPAEFQHTPNCMHITYSDAETYTSQSKFIRENDGVDLGRLDSVHNIYKQVAHGDVTVAQGLENLDELMRREPKFPKWVLVLMYGLGSAVVGPFAFGARPIDMPIAFGLGTIVGVLQYYVNPLSELWASIFPILATILTSALARLFGIISSDGAPVFCFSALVQSSIALVLPGFIVLRSALEIQLGQTNAGANRLVSGLFISVLQAFGITIGTVIVGAAFPHSSVAATCPTRALNYRWNFLFVPIFTLCLIIINQAKRRQVLSAMIVAISGYHTTFWVTRFIPGPFIGNAAGGLVVGLLANIYSRIGYRWEQKVIDYYRSRFLQKLPDRSSRRPTYGLAAAAMLPAIWVQVPSGIAAYGSLASGIASAEQITEHKTGTAALLPVLTVGLSVVQFAVGLAGGLLLGTLLVYPRTKKTGGVFSM